MSKAIFLTGTGTDIGKTFIAGLIVKKLAQAGNESKCFFVYALHTFMNSHERK